MDKQELKIKLDDEYTNSQESTLLGMIKDFYNRKMRSIVILVWSMALIFLGIAIFCAIQFYRTEQVKLLIMYAALFVVCAHLLDVMKIFAWQMIHRNSIKREIKRLEIRIAELTEALRSK